jgi:hypothetical protein
MFERHQEALGENTARFLYFYIFIFFIFSTQRVHLDLLLGNVQVIYEINSSIVSRVLERKSVKSDDFF